MPGASVRVTSSRFSTRAVLDAKRGSSGRPARPNDSQKRRNVASLPIDSTTWPSDVSNTWYGAMFGCWLPSRAGFSLVAR
jgi:hypothetical protein